MEVTRLCIDIGYAVSAGRGECKGGECKGGEWWTGIALISGRVASLPLSSDLPYRWIFGVVVLGEDDDGLFEWAFVFMMSIVVFWSAV